MTEDVRNLMRQARWSLAGVAAAYLFTMPFVMRGIAATIAPLEGSMRTSAIVAGIGGFLVLPLMLGVATLNLHRAIVRLNAAHTSAT